MLLVYLVDTHTLSNAFDCVVAGIMNTTLAIENYDANHRLQGL